MPKRRPAESRPLLVEPPAFLVAMPRTAVKRLGDVAAAAAAVAVAVIQTDDAHRCEDRKSALLFIIMSECNWGSCIQERGCWLQGVTACSSLESDCLLSIASKKKVRHCESAAPLVSRLSSRSSVGQWILMNHTAMRQRTLHQ